VDRELLLRRSAGPGLALAVDQESGIRLLVWNEDCGLSCSQNTKCPLFIDKYLKFLLAR